MGLLAFGFAIALICGFAATWLYLARIERLVIEGVIRQDDLKEAVERQFKELESKANPPAKVTDPFKPNKHIASSSKQIVVPKSPDQIRNENAKKIMEGAEYGYID